MKVPSSLAALFLISAFSATAQVGIPSNPMVGPKKYQARGVGGTADPGATVDGTRGTTRYTTHIILFEYRMWTSADGKPLEGKLLAFEDMVADVPEGGAEPAFPPPPARPTVIKDGKVRLLVDKKPYEVPLQRLSARDVEFIQQIRAALEKKAAAGN